MEQKTIVLHMIHGESESTVYLQFGPGTQNPSVQIVNTIVKERPCRLQLKRIDQL